MACETHTAAQLCLTVPLHSFLHFPDTLGCNTDLGPLHYTCHKCVSACPLLRLFVTHATNGNPHVCLCQPFQEVEHWNHCKILEQLHIQVCIACFYVDHGGRTGHPVASVQRPAACGTHRPRPHTPQHGGGLDGHAQGNEGSPVMCYTQWHLCTGGNDKLYSACSIVQVAVGWFQRVTIVGQADTSRNQSRKPPKEHTRARRW